MFGEILHFYPLNELISNLMPATGLKKVGTFEKIQLDVAQPYHPVAQDRFPTEAKQGWAWSVPGWETSWEKLGCCWKRWLVRPAGGAHPVVCVGPNTPV